SKLPYVSSIPRYFAPFSVAHSILFSSGKCGKCSKRVFISDKIQSLSFDARLSVPSTIGNLEFINKSIFGNRSSIYKLAFGHKHQVTSFLYRSTKLISLKAV